MVPVINWEGKGCFCFVLFLFSFWRSKNGIQDGTGYKMYEDFPKELHDSRKAQMNKLKKARQEGKRANFRKSEPDKLYIDGKYVKM